MKKRTAIFIVDAIIILAIVALLCCLTRQCHSNPTSSVKTEIVYDTIRHHMTIPVDSTVIKYVKVKLPVSDTIKNTDTVYVALRDSVEVAVPITKKEYRDSTYRAWISGYQANLDSIQVFQRQITITKQITPKIKRWGLGLQTGVGATPSKIEPYIGVGITYNLFMW